MRIRSIHPVVIVDAIEPLLPFWELKTGMARVAAVDEPGSIGFVILGGGEAQVMFQTRSSLAEDLPRVAAEKPAIVLYVDVDSIDELEASLGDIEVLVPRRRTFYGAKEVWVRDASGAIVGYAE